MSKNRFGQLLYLVLFLSSSLHSQNRNHEHAPARTNLGNIPLYFEENRVQGDPRARFISRGTKQVAFVTEEGLMLPVKDDPIALRIVDAARNAPIAAEGEVEGVSNYYLGKRAIRGLRHYSNVRVSNIRPGIDIVYHGNEQNLEYDLVVHPGANPESLRFRFEGGSGPRIADNGDLVLKTSSGELRQQVPRVWQKVGGRRREIACKYVLSRPEEVRLELSRYWRSNGLVIDPIASYSTYLAGTGTDTPTAIAADNSGFAYIAGYTNS